VSVESENNFALSLATSGRGPLLCASYSWLVLPSVVFWPVLLGVRPWYRVLSPRSADSQGEDIGAGGGAA
jgi:hypothetical protein